MSTAESSWLPRFECIARKFAVPFTMRARFLAGDRTVAGRGDIGGFAGTWLDTEMTVLVLRMSASWRERFAVFNRLLLAI